MKVGTWILISAGIMSAALVATCVRVTTTFDLAAETEIVMLRPRAADQQEWKFEKVRLTQRIGDSVGRIVSGRLTFADSVNVRVERLSQGPMYITMEPRGSRPALGTFELDSAQDIHLAVYATITITDVESRARSGNPIVLPVSSPLQVGRSPDAGSDQPIPLLRGGSVAMLGVSVLRSKSFSSGTAELRPGDAFTIAFPLSDSRGFIAADERPAMSVAYRADARSASVIRPGGNAPRLGNSLYTYLRADTALQGFVTIIVFLITSATQVSRWRPRVLWRRLPRKVTRMTGRVLMGACISMASSEAEGQSVGIEAGEKGQGITLMRAEGECFIVAPLHVLDGRDSSISAIGEGGRKLDAQIRRPFPESDLVILEIEADPAFACGTWNIPERLADLLTGEMATAVLRYRQERGDIEFMPVWIRTVGAEKVIVAPRVPGEQISEGMSGSQLIVNGVFSGLLLRRLENGSGEVIRSDHVQRLVSAFFATRPRPAAPLVIEEANLILLRGRSVVLGDQGAVFGVYDIMHNRGAKVRLNGVSHDMEPGMRLPFPDSRRDCFITLIRFENISPVSNGSEEIAFRVVCQPRRE